MAFNDFDEYQGSPTIDYAVESASAVRKGKIAWSNIDALIAELFPSGSNTLAYPTNDYLRASRLSIVPLAKEEDVTTTSSSDLSLATLNSYNFAEVTIEYETSEEDDEGGGGGGGGGGDPQDPQDPVSLLKHRWSPGGEFLTVPSFGWEWSFDSKEIDRDLELGIMVPTIEHQITWPRVVSPPFSAIRSTIGRVNASPINFKTGEIVEETLLFLGADLQREILSTGALAWEVSYRFSEKKVDAGDFGVASDSSSGGWNHFFRSDEEFSNATPKVGFYRVKGRTEYLGDGTYSGTARDPYTLKDFAPLFVEE